MEKSKLEKYWNELPIGKENAITYKELCPVWDGNERAIRRILQELGTYDNGDNYILIRSAAKRGGFYRTDDETEIKLYRKECLNKGKAFFAPVKKINRVLQADHDQFTFVNNLRVIREELKMKQSEVCKLLKKFDKSVDKSMLSKMENGVCIPTPYQLSLLGTIYGRDPSELIDLSVYLH